MPAVTNPIPLDTTLTTVLVNPCSGRYAEYQDEIQTLREHPSVTLIECESRDDTIQNAMQAIADGCQLLIAAGGDGTVNSVVQALGEAGDSPPALAILPLGTGNDLARNFGFSQDPAAMVKSVVTEELPTFARRVDLLKVRYDDQAVFALNMVSMGNSPRWIAAATPEQKALLGRLSYLQQSAQMLLETESFSVSLQIDDRAPRRIECFNIAVANGRAAGGGFVIAPEARFDDGFATVSIFEGAGLMELLQVIAEFAEMQLGDNPFNRMQIEHQRAKSVVIDADEPLPVSIDGEVCAASHVQVDIRPGCLQVVGILDPGLT